MNQWQEYLPDNIFLVGKMASGKDFIAARLVEEAGFTRLAFADALRAEVAEHLGISVDELNAKKASLRPLLQQWGIARRRDDDYYWIRRWAERRAKIAGPVVCSDCRFPNEARYGLRSGALLVRVKTPDGVRERRLRQRDGAFDPAWFTHPSELHVDSLPVQAEISGEMPAEFYVPALAEVYRSLLIVRDFITGAENVSSEYC